MANVVVVRLLAALFYGVSSFMITVSNKVVLTSYKWVNKEHQNNVWHDGSWTGQHDKLVEAHHSTHVSRHMGDKPFRRQTFGRQILTLLLPKRLPPKRFVAHLLRTVYLNTADCFLLTLKIRIFTADHCLLCHAVSFALLLELTHYVPFLCYIIC